MERSSKQLTYIRMKHNSLESKDPQLELIIKLREGLSRLRASRDLELSGQDRKQEQQQMEDTIAVLRRELQERVGNKEADRIIIDLREEILGERFD